MIKEQLEELEELEEQPASEEANQEPLETLSMHLGRLQELQVEGQRLIDGMLEKLAMMRAMGMMLERVGDVDKRDKALGGEGEKP